MTEEVHTDKHFYYVSVFDAESNAGKGRRGLLAGPYDTHAAALAMVRTVRRMAEDADPRACWYAFGTAGSDAPLKTVFGKVEMPLPTHVGRLEAERDRQGRML